MVIKHHVAKVILVTYASFHCNVCACHALGNIHQFSRAPVFKYMMKAKKTTVVSTHK